MSRLLLLRSGGTEEGGAPLAPGVDVLVTHEVAPRPDGVGEAVRFALAAAAERTVLLVTSRSAVRSLSPAWEERGLFRLPWRSVLAAGGETARELCDRGAPAVTVPPEPGAAGIVPPLLALLAGDASPLRLLWPRGSDADPSPFAPARERAGAFSDPVVYEKRPVPPPRELLGRLAGGEWGAVAVSSLAALDVLLAGLAAARLPVPNVRWGAVGPATARAFAARGLPEPVVPAHPRLADLIATLSQMETEVR